MRGTRCVIGLNEDGEATGFDLTLFPNEAAVLYAPNGWGKSTLFAAITGLIPIQKGEIILNGHPIHNLPVWARIERGVSALPSGQNTFPSLSCEESLRLSRKKVFLSKELSRFSGCPTGSLSGGQKQKIALQTMTVSNFNLYDEPFAGLDSPNAFLQQRAGKLARNQATLVLMPNVRN